MFRWLKRTCHNPRTPARLRLRLEPLETRDCPSGPPSYVINPDGPTITSFTAQVMTGTNVMLRGTLIDSHPASCEVTFSGVVTGEAEADAAGTFALFTPASALGTITAQAVDGENLRSNQAQATITSNVPSLTLTASGQGASGAITLSGRVTDESAAGLTVIFRGAVTATAVTDNNGDYSLTTTSWRPGNVTVQTTDAWGLTSNTPSATLTNTAPVISNFTAVPTSGGYWTFQGQVTDEYAPGQTVRLSGIPTLDGTSGYTTVTVGSNGWFDFSVQLTSQDHGCVSAQAIDWQGLMSDVVTYNV
jgi:hypothetical protein